jgi:hypothetical protein
VVSFCVCDVVVGRATGWIGLLCCLLREEGGRLRWVDGEIGGGGGFASVEDRLQIDSVALTGLAVPCVDVILPGGE